MWIKNWAFGLFAALALVAAPLTAAADPPADPEWGDCKNYNISIGEDEEWGGCIATAQFLNLSNKEAAWRMISRIPLENKEAIEKLNKRVMAAAKRWLLAHYGYRLSREEVYGNGKKEDDDDYKAPMDAAAIGNYISEPALRIDAGRQPRPAVRKTEVPTTPVATQPLPPRRPALYLAAEATAAAPTPPPAQAVPTACPPPEEEKPASTAARTGGWLPRHLAAPPSGP